MAESEPSRVHGHYDSLVGAGKAKLGEKTHKPDMEIKGKAQHLAGEAEIRNATGKDACPVAHPTEYRENKKFDREAGHVPTNPEPSSMHGHYDQTVGTAKEKIGKAMKKPDMEMKGKAQKIAGNLEVNAAKDE